MHPDVSLRGDAVQPVRGDRLAFLLVAGIAAAAPAHIWAPLIVASHGVTVGFACGMVLVLHQAPRVLSRLGRMPAALALIGLLVPYGVLSGLVAAPTPEFAARVLRHALLFAFAVALLIAAASIRFRWSEWRRTIPLLGAAYSATIAYGAYQVLARRNGWPFAFLPVTNPSLSTDPSGLQPGASLDLTLVYASRASSFFVEPTNFGMYLGYGTAVSMALVALGGRERRWGLAGLVLTAIGFASNQSLTAVLVCGLVLAYYALQALATGRGRLVLGIAMAVAVAGAAFTAVPGALEGISQRLALLSIEASSGRFTALPAVLHAFDTQPLGWGFAGHARLDEMVHNGALVFLMDFGVLGAFALAAWPCWAAARWVRAVVDLRAGRPEEAAAALFGGSLVMVHLGIFLSSGILHEPLFWAATGLGVAAGRPAPATEAPPALGCHPELPCP